MMCAAPRVILIRGTQLGPSLPADFCLTVARGDHLHLFIFIIYFLNFFLLGWDYLGDLLMWKDWAVLPEGIN